jgi:ubiquinone/menaquinone biosynthesis C-methylase UbiE
VDPREVREKYDAFAPSYDWAEGFLELLFGIRRMRRDLLQSATGRVLEVAIGTGNSLAGYPTDCSVTGVDISSGMMQQVGRRDGRPGRPVTLAQMDTHQLGISDGVFDTVVDSLCLCTYNDPVNALQEMARVCRPGGKILLLEHGRSSSKRLGRLQDKWAEWHKSALGCVWNREPQELVTAAGLNIAAQRRKLFGVFHILEVSPPST